MNSSDLPISALNVVSDSTTSLISSAQDHLIRTSLSSTSFSEEISEDISYGSLNEKVLSQKTINPRVVDAHYAVRGELSIRADYLRKVLTEAPESFPFKEVVSCNVGNPQHLGQKPLSFIMQVCSLLEYPDLMLDEKKNESIRAFFPEDALARAISLSRRLGPLGAYSQSQGNLSIRENAARFIERRDGFASNPENIFLTSGASSAIQMILQLLINDNSIGILIPSPQYPLYSATISLLGGSAIYYDLDEESGWSLSIDEIFRAVNRARLNGVNVRALCIINPGNPTGNVLSKENLQQIIHFCHGEKLVLLSDEVYQENVYYSDDKPFHSAKKIAKEMGEPYASLELFSFHSVSKGLLGECGKRAGYVECSGIDETVMAQIYKLSSIALCSNTIGQSLIDLMVDPPKPGDPSFERFEKERLDIHESLKRRSIMMVEAMRKLEGVTCQTPEGAMYLYPRYQFPEKFLEEARTLNRQPDTLYALKLLNGTGICGVSGSGFGQKPGTYHIRFTFLPHEESFPQFLSLLESFHIQFMNEYR